MAFTKTKVWRVPPPTDPIEPRAYVPRPTAELHSYDPSGRLPEQRAYAPAATRISEARPSVPLPAHVEPRAYVPATTRIAPLVDLLEPEPDPRVLPPLPQRSWAREALLAVAAFVVAGSATVALSMRSAEAYKPPSLPKPDRAVAAALASTPPASTPPPTEVRTALARNAERAAVDALARGDRAEAARRYQELATHFPERRELGEAARILAHEAGR